MYNVKGLDPRRFLPFENSGLLSLGAYARLAGDRQKIPSADSRSLGPRLLIGLSKFRAAAQASVDGGTPAPYIF